MMRGGNEEEKSIKIKEKIKNKTNNNKKNEA